MNIRVKNGASILGKDGKHYLAGQVLNVPDAVAEEHIRSGFAVPVNEGFESQRPATADETKSVPLPPGAEVRPAIGGLGDSDDKATRIDKADSLVVTTGALPSAQTSKSSVASVTPISKFMYDPSKLSQMDDNQLLALLADVDPDVKNIPNREAAIAHLSKDFGK